MRWRVPPRLLLLALFLALLLLALNASAYLTLIQVRGTMEQELGERLLAVASATAAGLSPAEVAAAGDSLPAGAPDATGALRDRLARIAFETDLGDLYLFDPHRRHLTDAAGRYPAGHAHPAIELHYAAATAALAGVPAASALYRVEGLYLKTAFAPAFDGEGRVIAVVAAEGGAGHFGALAGLRRQVYVSAAAGMIVVLLLTVYFYRLMRARALAERTLRQTAALAAAGELAAMLAHEIRNPLAVVSSRAERVRAKISQGVPAEDVLEWFEAIPREVARLDEILARYLSLARPPAQRAEADLGATVGTVLELMEGELRRQGVALRWTPPPEPLRCDFPAAALHQILVNLLLNARDALPRGGTVSLAAHRSGGEIALSVCDTGAGLTEEQQRRAFDPFYTTKPGGSGLGLTVVRSLLDLYGGGVELKGAPGRGACFHLRLPASGGPGSRGERSGEAR